MSVLRAYKSTGGVASPTPAGSHAPLPLVCYSVNQSRPHPPARASQSARGRWLHPGPLPLSTGSICRLEAESFGHTRLLYDYSSLSLLLSPVVDVLLLCVRGFALRVCCKTKKQQRLRHMYYTSSTSRARYFGVCIIWLADECGVRTAH